MGTNIRNIILEIYANISDIKVFPDTAQEVLLFLQ